ncbi:MAG: efflux RND transporter periplasmic adaptor subunit [Myxococcales bacterium]|nr:efflux RND transporter periplasmic adaptor subunit [Myxococcales bacterium]
MAKKPLRKRRWGWLVWLVILGVAGGLGVRAMKRRPVKAIDVSVHRVETGSVRDLVSTVAAGRVAAEREATLRAEIAGTVLRVHKRRGDRVAEGEVLLEYDVRDLRDRVSAARAAVSLSRAQIEQARASAAVARRNALRAVDLRDRGVGTAAEAENLEGSAGVAERAAGVAEVGASQALANVRVAETALRRGVLRAPFAGIVLTRTIEQGEVTAPGAPLFTLADPSRLHVDADLDEADLGRVRVGLRAEVVLDAFQGQRFAGTLSEIAPSVTRDLRGNRSISCRFDLQPDERLRVGMSAEVDVIVATRESVLWVPPNAVMGRGIDRSVYVVDAQNTARRRAIGIGVSTWEAIEVTSGLRAGDRVITTLSNNELADGSIVRARAAETAPTRSVQR